MTPFYRTITMALGVALTLAMFQTSDAQLFRLRRNAKAYQQQQQQQCCCDQSAAVAAPVATPAPEIVYEAPQAAAPLAAPPVAIESAPTFPVVEAAYNPVVLQAQPVVEQAVAQAPVAIDYPIIESNVLPTVFESTPSPVTEDSGLVIYDSPSDNSVENSVLETPITIETPTVAPENPVVLGDAAVANPASPIVATPAPAGSEIVLAAPAATVVPEPVPTGETVIKEKAEVVVPTMTKASDALKAADSIKPNAVEAGESILK